MHQNIVHQQIPTINDKSGKITKSQLMAGHSIAHSAVVPWHRRNHAGTTGVCRSSGPSGKARLHRHPALPWEGPSFRRGPTAKDGGQHIEIESGVTVTLLDHSDSDHNQPSAFIISTVKKPLSARKTHTHKQKNRKSSNLEALSSQCKFSSDW